jgi:hypothetical protein
LRPLGPSVTLTAFARMFTPRTMPERADSPKRTSLAAMINFSVTNKKFFERKPVQKEPFRINMGMQCEALVADVYACTRGRKQRSSAPQIYF